MAKKVFTVLISACLLISLCACGGTPTASPTPTPSPTRSASPTPSASPEASPDPTKTHVVIDTEKGIIKAELYPDIAPITVANFQKLVDEKFYDGLTFHRIIDGFMIQGGDPNGDGTGGSEETIKGEFSANGVKNDLKHERGVLSMARSQSMNSASSQFFIMHADASYLDGQYAAFGRVTEGMDVVDQIVADAVVQDTNGTVLPEDQPVINSIYFE